MSSEPESTPSLALQRYAWFVAIFVFLLVIAGGLVTSTGSALAVPDWPLSFGKFFPPMVGGVLYEHGHRMIAATAGFLTIILTVWLWRGQENRVLRWLGVAAIGVVCLQGLLGGLTVLLRLPAPISVGHACLGQTFFCVIVSIAVLSSVIGVEDEPHVVTGARKVQRLSVLTVVFVYLQLIAGAIYRHTGWTPAFHMHLLGAFLVALHAMLLGLRILPDPEMPQDLRAPATALLALVGAQVLIGFFAWKLPLVWVTTTHVGNGALVLATSVIVAIQAFRRLIPSLRVDA
jgi:heme a synthase